VGVGRGGVFEVASTTCVPRVRHLQTARPIGTGTGNRPSRSAAELAGPALPQTSRPSRIGNHALSRLTVRQRGPLAVVLLLLVQALGASVVPVSAVAQGSHSRLVSTVDVSERTAKPQSGPRHPSRTQGPAYI
jgi:hypothetical protein